MQTSSIIQVIRGGASALFAIGAIFNAEPLWPQQPDFRGDPAHAAPGNRAAENRAPSSQSQKPVHRAIPIFDDRIAKTYFIKIHSQNYPPLNDPSFHLILIDFKNRGNGYGGEQDGFMSMIVTVNVSCKNQSVTWVKIIPYVGNMASQGVFDGRTHLYEKYIGEVSKVDTTGMYHSIFLNVCKPQIVAEDGNILLRNYFSSGSGFEKFQGSPFLDQWVRYYQNFGISTVAQLKAAEARMRAAGFEIPSDLKEMYFGKAGDGALLEFLRDESDAKDKGVTIAEARRLRLAWVAQRKAEMAREEAQQAVARRAEQARVFRAYPYVAVISCGLNGWENINVLACFVGSNSGAATELEINNGGAYSLYKPHEIAGSFIEKSRGIEISLKSKFSLKIQNSSRSLKLGLRVLDRSGNVLYQRQVSQYGVIYTSR